LFAGSVPDGEEIKNNSGVAVGSAGNQPIAMIAEAVKSGYVKLKRKRVEETILAPLLGADFDRFQQLVAQSAGSQLLQQILGLLMQHNLQLELLVVGTDSDGAKLFVVTHPGQALPTGSTGFATIGSGALHAAVRLSLGQHTPGASLPETVYNVYEAKRAAEVSPGVGKITDMTILTSGKIVPVGDEIFELLDTFHKERPAPSPDELNQLRIAVEECAKDAA
jgi:hypothetical protein